MVTSDWPKCRRTGSSSTNMASWSLLSECIQSRGFFHIVFPHFSFLWGDEWPQAILANSPESPNLKWLHYYSKDLYKTFVQWEGKKGVSVIKNVVFGAKGVEFTMTAIKSLEVVEYLQCLLLASMPTLYYKVHILKKPKKISHSHQLWFVTY